MNRHGAKLAKVAGDPGSEISFAERCMFGTALGTSRYAEFESGIVLVTRQFVSVLQGNPPHVWLARKIRFNDLDGVVLKRHGFSRQIQLLGRSGKVTAITLVGADRRERSELLYEELRARGVPEWEGRGLIVPEPDPVLIYVPVAPAR